VPLTDFAERAPQLCKQLARARASNRIAHAYLFTGDNIESVTELAVAWSQACACPNMADGDACGTCQICTQLRDHRYAQMTIIRPQSKSRVIKIERMRDLERMLNLKSGGVLRIGLIVDAERMNENAQNAFLKTLEEPAPNTLLILATTNPGAMLATIRSRCQIVPMIENRVSFELKDRDNFFAALADLRAKSGTLVARRVANRVITQLKDLKKQADDAAKEQLQARSDAFRELDPAIRKQLEEEAKAIAASDYLGGREAVLGALHTWFAQEYMRAAGVDPECMPNPEAYNAVPEPAPISVPEAEHNLKRAESLVADLRFNIDEQLAINDFCQRLCART
jgi:DNA polymerase-3 subunit delta'